MSYVKSMYARAKLTDEQMKKVQALVDDLAQGRDLKVNWPDYSKLAEKISGLLTVEQKEALKSPYAASGWGRPPALDHGLRDRRKRWSARHGHAGPQRPQHLHRRHHRQRRHADHHRRHCRCPVAKPGEKKPSGIKVTQLPGGGIQVTISEDVRLESNMAQPQARGSVEQPMKSAQARMREKVKRQHELAEQAWQASEKLAALGPDKKAEAHEAVGEVGAAGGRSLAGRSSRRPLPAFRGQERGSRRASRQCSG